MGESVNTSELPELPMCWDGPDSISEQVWGARPSVLRSARKESVRTLAKSLV